MKNVDPASVPKTMDEYLAGLPEPAHTTLSKLRAVIRSAAPPDATEAITYRIPAVKYKGSLVAYAAFADHCSFFPMGSSLLEVFKKELRGFSTSKGTIRFSVDKPLSATLVKKMVKARIAQNEHKEQR